MLSKCSYNGRLDWALNVYGLKRESELMKNTYPWKHLGLFPRLYGVFITTSLQHCSKVKGMFKLNLSMLPFLNPVQYTAPLGLQEYAWGQTGVQQITLTGNKWLTWPANHLWELHLGRDYRRLLLKGEAAPRLSDCQRPSFNFLLYLS